MTYCLRCQAELEIGDYVYCEDCAEIVGTDGELLEGED